MAYLPGGTLQNPDYILITPYGAALSGEIRASQTYTLLDLPNKYELDTYRYGTRLAGAGTVTHVANQGALNLAVGATNADEATLRTNTYYRYQAGKGIRIKQSLYHADAGQTNQTRLWGFGDDNDGIYFQLTGTVLQLTRRTSTSGGVVNNAIARSSWNQDKLDGSGPGGGNPSGVTLDLTKVNNYEIVLQLGAGIIQFFINTIFVHQEVLFNNIAVPFMKTAQLPLSWQVINTGASTGSSMTNVSSSIIVESGEDPLYETFAAYRTDDVMVTTTETALLTVRPKLTYNSITNRMSIIPAMLNVGCESGRIGVRVILNATLGGSPSYTSADTRSGAEFDIAGTTVSGGTTIYRTSLFNSADSQNINLTPFFDIRSPKMRVNAFATSQDTITIAAINENIGESATRCCLIWKEIR